MIRQTTILRLARRLASIATFSLVMAVIALGSAGVIAIWSHPPGTSARAELTWHEDQVLGSQLNGAQADLEAIAADTDRLAVLARGAVGALTADDQGPFGESLAEGTRLAVSIESASDELRASLTTLPGGAATDTMTFGLDVLARRSGLLSAIDATSGLARSWATLTVGSLQASRLISLLGVHDTSVAAAAAEGRAADYESALATLDDALARLDAAVEIRNQLANTSDVTTLDEWVARNRTYDEALKRLYVALGDSGGAVTDAVRDAYRDEGLARAGLPPDPRGLVVILADIGRGGLNQAVIAIDQARARLTVALEALS
ncbi:MAG: hypothetical protein ABIQ17_05960 [Candidatus Limnocylindrales bacterium]